MTLEGFQSWVLQTGATISVLILVILIIRRPFARLFGANAAYALWSLPLIRLFLPGLSVPENWLPSRMRPAAETAQGLEISPDVAFQSIQTVTRSPGGELTAEPSVSFISILISFWLGVAALWFVYQLYQQLRFKAGLRAASHKLTPALFDEVLNAAQRVGLSKIPAIRTSNSHLGPLVTGVFRPLVILPQNFEETFDPPQRHFALVHEFAHIKRGDLWVALATLIFRAINWPNPLVHYASHKMRGDQEAACDAFVVKVTGGETTHSYAETLVKAVRQDGGVSKAHAHLALSLAEADSEISKGD